MYGGYVPVMGDFAREEKDDVGSEVGGASASDDGARRRVPSDGRDYAEELRVAPGAYGSFSSRSQQKMENAINSGALQDVQDALADAVQDKERSSQRAIPRADAPPSSFLPTLPRLSTSTSTFVLTVVFSMFGAGLLLVNLPEYMFSIVICLLVPVVGLGALGFLQVLIASQRLRYVDRDAAFMRRHEEAMRVAVACKDRERQMELGTQQSIHERKRHRFGQQVLGCLWLDQPFFGLLPHAYPLKELFRWSSGFANNMCSRHVCSAYDLGVLQFTERIFLEYPDYDSVRIVLEFDQNNPFTLNQRVSRTYRRPGGFEAVIPEYWVAQVDAGAFETQFDENAYTGWAVTHTVPLRSTTQDEARARMSKYFPHLTPLDFYHGVCPDPSLDSSGLAMARDFQIPSFFDWFNVANFQWSTFKGRAPRSLYPHNFDQFSDSLIAGVLVNNVIRALVVMGDKNPECFGLAARCEATHPGFPRATRTYPFEEGGMPHEAEEAYYDPPQSKC